MSHTLRCLWPVVDPSIPLRELLAEAAADLPEVATRAHAKVTGPGRWSMAPSEAVPGSGRVTDTVLIFEAPAEPRWTTARGTR